MSGKLHSLAIRFGPRLVSALGFPIFLLLYQDCSLEESILFLTAFSQLNLALLVSCVPFTQTNLVSLLGGKIVVTGFALFAFLSSVLLIFQFGGPILQISFAFLFISYLLETIAKSRGMHNQHFLSVGVVFFLCAVLLLKTTSWENEILFYTSVRFFAALIVAVHCIQKTTLVLKDLAWDWRLRHFDTGFLPSIFFPASVALVTLAFAEREDVVLIRILLSMISLISIIQIVRFYERKMNFSILSLNRPIACLFGLLCYQIFIGGIDLASGIVCVTIMSVLNKDLNLIGSHVELRFFYMVIAGTLAALAELIWLGALHGIFTFTIFALLILIFQRMSLGKRA
jgi:hypothetical protein